MKLILKLIYLFPICYLYSAGPITHLYLAEVWCDMNGEPSEYNKGLFLKGSTFPDIRYVANIARSKTHLRHVKYSSINEEDDWFEKGIKFHCFVDEKREAFVRKNNLYALIGLYSKFKQATLLKTAEDQYFFDKPSYSNYQTLYLGPTTPEEVSWDIPKGILLKWNIFLALYTSVEPTFLISQLRAEGENLFDLSPLALEEWEIVIPKIVVNPNFIEYCENLVKEFQAEFAG